jgi:hypothetical protein
MPGVAFAFGNTEHYDGRPEGPDVYQQFSHWRLVGA